MRWYRHLYVGERAKKKRFSIIQRIRLHLVLPGVYVITPASNPQNLFDIWPTAVLLNKKDKNWEDILIVGIGADYDDALETVRRIVDDMYRETGGFSVDEFLSKNGQR